MVEVTFWLGTIVLGVSLLVLVSGALFRREFTNPWALAFSTGIALVMISGSVETESPIAKMFPLATAFAGFGLSAMFFRGRQNSTNGNDGPN